MLCFPRQFLSGFYRTLLLLWSVLGACLSFQANASVVDTLRYDIRTVATFSGGENTPFWLVSNLQGLGSPEKNYGYARASLLKELDTSKRFSWGAGVDLVGAWHTSAPFQIHQLYGELKYRSLGLLVGSKELWCDYNDPKLSSGSLLFSGNALPIPQIRVGFFDYVIVPGSRNRFAIKGYLSYGMFTDSGWQKSWAAEGTKRTSDVLFHSKGIWFRFGNVDRSPVTGDFGLEMATQFGGTAYENGKVIHMGHGFLDWLKALIPIANTEETLLGNIRSVKGNMVGEWTAGLTVRPQGKDWGIRAYYEHLFEDHSMLFWEYLWKDGLYGIEGTLPRNRYVSKIVYEFLYTKDQAGAVNNDSSDMVPEQVSGRDNYYGHSLYSGWQHWGMGIGNPLLISPIYNADHTVRFLSTRVIGHHFAFSGNPTNDINYRVLLSYSKSWGTYTHPLPDVLDNLNGLLELNWHPKRLRGWYGGIGLAFDSGDMLGKSFGVGITIGKRDILSF